MRALCVMILIVSSSCVGALAQSEREYVNSAENFKITLIGDWAPVSYADAIGRQKTEFIFHDRNEGLLRVVKERLSGRMLNEKVRSDLEDLKLRYACLYTGQEPINGALGGIRLALYYFENGRWIVGTHYYLKDADAVWLLRFSGRPGSTGMAREMTDKIALSLCSVCNIPFGEAEQPRILQRASPVGRSSN